VEVCSVKKTTESEKAPRGGQFADEREIPVHSRRLQTWRSGGGCWKAVCGEAGEKKSTTPQMCPAEEQMVTDDAWHTLIVDSVKTIVQVLI
jgi:hypothetical protein